jgi:hypothetical protein
VIGKLNAKSGFNKNKYLKFRFVDFQKFFIASEEIKTFFSYDPLLSKAEVHILVTNSYQISWDGIFSVEEAKKKVQIKVSFSNLETNFGIYFDDEEFNLLLNGFLNIAVDVFCYCLQARSVLKFFLEKVAEKNLDSADYLKKFQREDYLNLCSEICQQLQIPKLKSYFILDKLLMHKEDLLILTKMKTLYDSRLFLVDQSSIDTPNMCLYVDTSSSSTHILSSEI